jgi:hypothetical protein
MEQDARRLKELVESNEPAAASGDPDESFKDDSPQNEFRETNPSSNLTN